MSLRDLEKAMSAAAVLKEGLLQVTDDADTLRDTIEGSTSLHEAIRATLLSIEDDQAMVDGLDARTADLRARRDRFADRIEAKRALIEQAMTIGEVSKIELDLATAFLRPTAPKAIITQEAEIPSTYWEPQPPKLDKAALAAALKAGTAVPGATLSNGGVSLTIRRK